MFFPKYKFPYLKHAYIIVFVKSFIIKLLLTMALTTADFTLLFMPTDVFSSEDSVYFL